MASSINKMSKKNLVFAQTHYNPLQIQYCQNIGVFAKNLLQRGSLFVSALKYTKKSIMRENRYSLLNRSCKNQ